jgi:hypothetical protein
MCLLLASLTVPVSTGIDGPRSYGSRCRGFFLAAVSGGCLTFGPAFAQSRLILGPRARIRAQAAGQRRGQRFWLMGDERRNSLARPCKSLIEVDHRVGNRLELGLA